MSRKARGYVSFRPKNTDKICLLTGDDRMNYYIIEGDNCSALNRLYIVKALNKEEALDTVMTKYIDEMNKYHEEVNQEIGEILFPIYAKDDLLVLTIDEYIEKYGKESVIEIYVD